MPSTSFYTSTCFVKECVLLIWISRAAWPGTCSLDTLPLSGLKTELGLWGNDYKWNSICRWFVVSSITISSSLICWLEIDTEYDGQDHLVIFCRRLLPSGFIWSYWYNQVWFDSTISGITFHVVCEDYSQEDVTWVSIWQIMQLFSYQYHRLPSAIS